MKLEQLNEASYTSPTKKSIEGLLRFFNKNEATDSEHLSFETVNKYIVRNSKAGTNQDHDNIVINIEFSYAEDPEYSDLALVTYIDGDQDDIKIKDIAQHFVVHETRQVY